ncbi:cell growth-regulating nucleolar protein-like [Plakobranchus ocellatus]|uniref:Cell growth-regulating nucleolar protein-like n=1 Tax=Plakobranchus ocellatus TaxID=259542 RepID=A0AAV3YNI4_9GAST|nr:cell growth-regulating nucleolar protein-like [Plakobranchus ocellatus]
MVFFNCNACGEALKKNQVEKHALRCRNCQVLSCVDCGKDFWGNDYQSHTKCITEEEKYCGQGYVPKVNKGEVKQEQWIEKVQGAIERSPSNPGLRSLLVKLKDYPNIPRKQQKFQNFLKNSLRVYSDVLITQVWDTLMAHSAQVNNNKDEVKNATSKQNLNGSANGNHSSSSDKNETDETMTKPPEPKKSKREKKEERKNKTNKKEKKDRVETSENGEEQVKKSKKRKHRDQDADEDMSEEKSTELLNKPLDEQPPKKKKKKKHPAEGTISAESLEKNNEESDNNDCENSQPDVEEPKKKKKKFNWESIISQVLEDKGEMSLKKLRKKVLSEFAALDSANYSEENLLAKFDKKVRKMSNVQVLKDRAKLKGNK